MKFSSKVEQCGLSPVRKFYPYEIAASAKGIKIHHLNIGQPDIETPEIFFDAVRNFKDKVIEYAPAPGTPEYLEAVRDYYNRLGCNITGVNLVKLCSLVCMHLKDTSYTLLLILSCV